MTTTTTGRHDGPAGTPFTTTLGQQLVAGGHRRLRTERHRRTAVRGGVALTATTAVAAGTLGLLPGGGPAVDGAVAGTLQRASAIAADGPGLEDVRPGQYWYEASTDASAIVETDGGELIASEARSETWTGVDGAGAVLRHEEGPGGESFAVLFTPHGRDDYAPGFAEELAVLDTSPALLDGEEITEQVFVIGHDTGSYRELAALPTDPADLRDALVATMDRRPLGIGENPIENALFSSVSDMLAQPLPSELRASLFELLAGTGGITLSETTDQLDRDVVAVGIDVPGGELRDELLFEAGTGAFVGSRTLRQRSGDDEGQPGDVLAETVVVETAVVDQLGERP